mgnify:CR=1 FL=1
MYARVRSLVSLLNAGRKKKKKKKKKKRVCIGACS